MNEYVPINLAYDLYESSEGSDPNLNPVIFLHGHSSDRKTWKDIIPHVAEKTKRKAYAFDFRNYGESDYTDDFSLALLIEDIFHFMDSKNIQKAVLVGHSLGATLGSNAALQRPERVEMYISEDTFVRRFTNEEIIDSGDYVKILSSIIENIPIHLDEDEAVRHVIDEMFNGLSEDNKKWSPKEVLYRVRIPLRRKPDGRYYCGINTEVVHRKSHELTPMILEPVGTFEGPAVFLYGALSRCEIANKFSEIKKHFPKAEFIKFEGGCHSLHNQFKEKFIDSLALVLNRDH